MTQDAREYFGKHREKMMNAINTVTIGRIDTFDAERMVADVELVHDDDYIVSVPVSCIQTEDFYIRVPFKNGDLVVVAFAQHDIDEIMHDGDEAPTDRKFSKDDAIIVGGLNLFVDPLPAVDADKLTIGQKDGAARITMGGGIINLIGDVRANGSRVQTGGGTA